MLRRMRGAVPTQQRWSSFFRREEGRFFAVLSFAFVGACSVYTNSLVDGAAQPVTEGGSDAGAGRGGAGADASSTSGGTTQDRPAGGEGGEAEPSGGSAMNGGSAGSSTAGTDGGGAGGSSAGGSFGGSSGASGGGAGGTSGSAGSGGGVSDGPLLDGFEDNDLLVEQYDGRSGVWYTFDDGTTGTITPTPLTCTPLTDAPSELGKFAIHVTATGYSDYGSGLGVDFISGKMPYDASRYTGIRFWAKVGAGKNTRHRLQISDSNTDPMGGKCTTGSSAPQGAKCEDHYGKDLTLTSTWAQYTYAFADLIQLGWGYPPDNNTTKIDSTSLYGLQFKANSKLEVDLWIDQLEFY
jgi:Carbohydrate binding domain (family 11)